MGDSGDSDSQSGTDDGRIAEAESGTRQEDKSDGGVQHMNMLKAQAEEVILTELINN